MKKVACHGQEKQTENQKPTKHVTSGKPWSIYNKLRRLDKKELHIGNNKELNRLLTSIQSDYWDFKALNFQK